MFPNPSCLWFSFVLALWIINEFENVIPKTEMSALDYFWDTEESTYMYNILITG